MSTPDPSRSAFNRRSPLEQYSLGPSHFSRSSLLFREHPQAFG